jgi:hypothetical protein
MKRLILVLGIVGLVLVGAPHRATSQKPNEVSEFMQAKLGHAQKVLEGLALEDFEMIAKNSQDLSLLSQAARWRVLQTDSYLRYSIEFRNAADELTKAAQEKNLDGAALAYVSMTMKCVKCHKYVRGVRMAEVQPSLDLFRTVPVGEVVQSR